MKRFLAILFFCQSIQLVNAQYDFQKIIGNANATYGRDVLQTKDSGYVICGSSSGYGDYTANAYLLKLDIQGNYLWTKSYGGNNTDWATRMVENPDKSIVFTGYTNSSGNGGYDIWLVKTDSTGNLIWQKNYGGSDWDFGRCIISTSDGGYLISGETYSFGNGNSDAFLLKTDMNGDSLWMHTYGYAGMETGEKVIETAAGKYVVIGTSDAYAGQMKDAWLLKVHADGNLLWEQHYGSTKDESGMGIVLAANDEMYITGNTDSLSAQAEDIFLYHLDSAGAVMCYSPYGGNLDESARDVALRYNNNVLMAGLSYTYGYAGDFIIYQSDPGCFWQGGPTYGDAYVEEPWSIKPTLDSGCIVVGDTKDGPGMNSIFVVKLDASIPNTQNITTYFDVSAVQEINAGRFISVYPNPAGELLHISSDSQLKSLALYDVSGKLLLKKPVNSYYTELDLSSLPSGIYLLHVTDESGMIHPEKLLINH